MKFTRIHQKITSAVLGLAIVLLMGSCKEDEVMEPDVIGQTLQQEGFTVLSAAITAAGLQDDLAGMGPFTIFAPSDAAFAAAGLDASNVSTVDNLANILLYHVVSGTVTSSDLASGEVETLGGKYVTIDAGNLKVNDANIVAPIDIEASNGVIHTIDAVLMPMNNIVETALGSPELSILVDILGNYPAILSDLQNEAADLTVFAPTNDAFVALLDAIGQTDVNDVPPAVIESILKYHVLGSRVESTDLSDGLMATTLNGEDISVSDVGGSFTISGASIAAADLGTSNGVVHVVNSVLVPPSIGQFVNTIVEPAYFNNNFSTLIAAVTNASPSILETLLGAGPSGNGMTLFAPDNAAFAAENITATTLPDQATLDAVLTYHLIDGIVMAADLPVTDAAAPATIGTVGGDFYLSNKGGGVFINGSTQVTATDIDPADGAGNGILHLIDRVILPPSGNLVEVALANGFNSLAAALIEANLVSTVETGGPFTVFAPTDAAFTALYADLGVSGPGEIDDTLLEDVLLYHVLGLRAFSTDLVDDLSAPTASDADGAGTTNLVIDITNDGVTITDNNSGVANVTVTNVLATNGVIHVIDKVILP